MFSQDIFRQQTLVSVVLHVYISACEHLTVDHRAVIVCVNVSVS